MNQLENSRYETRGVNTGYTRILFEKGGKLHDKLHR